MKRVGLVAIGRNEGDRLRQCLLSVIEQVADIVYVDSGSTDDSVKLARSLGIDVVELDPSTPFSAARARNTGFNHLIQINSQIEYVQFIDGDCEMVAGWLDRAERELDTQPQVAVVFGRRRERFPERSVYNQLCDMEWDTPIGETTWCGGDTMMRVTPFQEVGGFNPTLIAGEEPEFCLRVRQKGWKILRLDAEMTLHDAQMTSFKQWWQRASRAGFAYAEGVRLHGHEPEYYCVKESQSIWLWGLLVPLLGLGMAVPTYGLSLILWAGYPFLTYRIYTYMQHRGFKSRDAAIYALFCILAKFPNLFGQLKFHLNNLLGQPTNLIEYKR